MPLNRPTDSELVEAVSEFLQNEIAPLIDRSDVRFRLKIANNVLGIIRRNLESGAEYTARECVALTQLTQSRDGDIEDLNKTLCKMIRDGQFDDRLGELAKALIEPTLDKLAIDNPRYSTFKALRN